MIIFQSLTKSDLIELLQPLSGELGSERAFKKARYRAHQLFKWVYQRFITDWDEMTDLSKDLRTWLKDHIQIDRLTEKSNQQALDGTHKFLWTLKDGKTIESVIIPAALQEKQEEDFSEEFSGKPSSKSIQSQEWSRLTACISSQVGCAMGCRFCLTGIQGLDRHLQVHEIVTQIYELRRLAPITNIVFMGMGEPLHNLRPIIQACKIFLDQDGFNFSKRKITVH